MGRGKRNQRKKDLKKIRERPEESNQPTKVLDPPPPCIRVAVRTRTKLVRLLDITSHTTTTRGVETTRTPKKKKKTGTVRHRSG